MFIPFKNLLTQTTGTVATTAGRCGVKSLPWSVTAQPQQIFGLDATMFPPFAFDLPKLPGTGDESPGYFDVVYLDDDLLIIQQSQPGGLFALVRVDSIDS